MADLEQYHPDRTYVHLGTGPEVSTIDVTPEFWSEIDQRTDLHSGRLITSFEMDADWPTWEMHPAGGEVIYVTQGEVEFHLDDGSSTSSATVAAPNYFVVPTGVWHTADALGTARLLVITWGEGTQNRPR